jgi:putative ABC transport system permease protein
MNTIAMALRNLSRSRRRTFLAALSVFIAMLLVVFLDGFIKGWVDSAARNYTKNTSGHVNVTTEEYRIRERFMPASAAMEDSDTVIAAIERTPGLNGRVDRVVARVNFGVVLSSASATKAALGIAGDPAAEKQLLMLDKSLLPGSRYLGAPRAAIAGEKLARTLGLKVGDDLKVIAERADYGMGFKKFHIVGLYRTGLESVDGSTFMVSLEDARDLLGLGKGASQILVMLKDYGEADRASALIAAQLRAAGLAKLSVKSWTSQSIAQTIKAEVGVLFWIQVVIDFLGAFIIANVMTMALLERRREIGILKSMGMSTASILRLFLAEGTMIGVLGSAAGAIVGAAINLYFKANGLDLGNSMATSSLPADNIVRFVVQPMEILALFGLGALASAVVAYLPARRAARLDPIDAIRSI